MSTTEEVKAEGIVSKAEHRAEEVLSTAKVTAKELLNVNKSELRETIEEVFSQKYMPYAENESKFWGENKQRITQLQTEIVEIKDNAKKHSDEDDENFGGVHDRLDKVQTDLSEILKVLQEQNKTYVEFKEKVAPVVKVFEENEIAQIHFERSGKKLIFYSGGFLTIGVAITYLISVIKSWPTK